MNLMKNNDERLIAGFECNKKQLSARYQYHPNTSYHDVNTKNYIFGTSSNFNDYGWGIFVPKNDIEIERTLGNSVIPLVPELICVAQRSINEHHEHPIEKKTISPFTSDQSKPINSICSRFDVCQMKRKFLLCEHRSAF